MTASRRLGLCAVAVVGGAACAGGTAASGPALMTGTMCGTDRVQVQDTTWREVRGDGFTYCVPETWRAVDDRGRRWRSPQGEFSFGAIAGGAPRRPFVVYRDDYGTKTNNAPSHATGSRQKVYFAARTNGRLVQLALDHPEGRTIRGNGTSERPTLAIEAMARTTEAADEILAAFRSIRFVSEP